ncbi:hypothetical protein GQ457_10G026540 [Hibiscus cannabinus]
MVLPTNVLLRLAAIPTPNASLGVDVPCWRWDNKQNFTTKSAYESLHTPCAPKSTLWGVIWRLPVPQRVRTFMWLAVLGKILTNHERLRRHLADSDTCSLCHDDIEDVVHVLRDCVRARSIWTQVIKTSKHPEFDSLSTRDWFIGMLTRSKEFAIECTDSEARFAVICWILCSQRNKSLFDTDTIITESIIHECDRILSGFQATKSTTTAKLVHPPLWCAPSQGWVTANVDGAVRLDDNATACGGVFRDSTGRWLFGFSRSLGYCPVLFAELWGVHDALKQAWCFGCKKLIIETDSTDVVDLLLRQHDVLRSDTLVVSIRQMLVQNWHVNIYKIDRDSNRVADALAGASRGSSIGETFYTTSPSFVQNLIMKDF